MVVARAVNSDIARELISIVLAVALFLTALTLIFRDRMVRRFSPYVATLTPRQIAALTVCMGVVLGVVVSISSVGAGAIGVTALILLYPRLPLARIVGSDIAHAVPLTLAAGVGHWMLGSIDWHIFASLILGSVPGIVMGSYVAVRVPEMALRVILATTLFAVATKLSSGLHPASIIASVTSR